MRIPTLAFTEEAIALIRITHADFAQLPRASRTARIGMVHASNIYPHHDFFQMRAQSELVRVVSIVEAFVSTAISYSFDHKIAGLEIFYSRLAEAAVIQSEASWEGRKIALKNYFDLSLGDAPKFHLLEGAFVVRNSIAHGLGNLTRRQRGVKDRQKIQSLGAMLVGDSIVLTDIALKNTADAAISVVEATDNKLARG